MSRIPHVLQTESQGEAFSMCFVFNQSDLYSGEELKASCFLPFVGNRTDVLKYFLLPSSRSKLHISYESIFYDTHHLRLSFGDYENKSISLYGLCFWLQCVDLKK